MDYVARYYDPYLARFVGADTIVPEPGNAQSLNRYMYVLGNPLRYTDPSGHCIPGVNCPGDRFSETGGMLEVDESTDETSTSEPTPTVPPASTPTAPPTLEPTPEYTEDEIAIARMAALEAGGEHVFGERRPDALSALSWVVVNREGYEGWWHGSYADIASSSEFNAVREDPDYQPTEAELQIARGVVSGETPDPTGGAVWFHDARLPVGEYSYAVENTVGRTLWGLYFYRIDQCPGGPDQVTGCAQ